MCLLVKNSKGLLLFCSLYVALGTLPFVVPKVPSHYWNKLANKIGDKGDFFFFFFSGVGVQLNLNITRTAAADFLEGEGNPYREGFLGHSPCSIAGTQEGCAWMLQFSSCFVSPQDQ